MSCTVTKVLFLASRTGEAHTVSYCTVKMRLRFSNHAQSLDRLVLVRNLLERVYCEGCILVALQRSATEFTFLWTSDNICPSTRYCSSHIDTRHSAHRIKVLHLLPLYKLQVVKLAFLAHEGQGAHWVPRWRCLAEPSHAPVARRQTPPSCRTARPRHQSRQCSAEGACGKLVMAAWAYRVKF